MQPVISKATAAIEAVAKENKISYVFDTSKGEFLVVPDSEDILPLVKKKLGITAPTPVAGATANVK
jgi:outer membrane protein